MPFFGGCEGHRLPSKLLDGLDAKERSPSLLSTDSKSAHDIMNSSNVTANSRHIERKVFKMKELCAWGIAKVTLVPTAENAADLLTKALETKVFKQHEHRATIMNLHAGSR